MKAAKIILIILFGIRVIIQLVKSCYKENTNERIGEILGTLVAAGINAYLYYLVGIFNL